MHRLTRYLFRFSLSGALLAMFEKSLNTSLNVSSAKQQTKHQLIGQLIGLVLSKVSGSITVLSFVVIYSVSQKIPPEVFWHFPPNGWEFLVKILHLYHTFLSTLDYKFLFNYLQLGQSYAILSATTQSGFRPMVDISIIWCELGCRA